MNGVAIRDAATIVLLRDGPDGPATLMGQRGAKAAFMPSKVVFPGGAVDPGDAAVRLAAPLEARTRRALAHDAIIAPEALAAAALRELGEETGQAIGQAIDQADGQPGAGCAWPAYRGLVPDPAPLRFVFRAITPPGRPRRFDARFFLTPAAALAGDPDRFDDADAELSHLRWVPLARARDLDLPFVTEVVLAEVQALVETGGPGEAGIPFFDNSGADSLFRRIPG